MGSLLLPLGSCCTQSLILWEFLLPLPDPQVGKRDVGLRTFIPVKDICGIIVLQFVNHPPSGYGIWFYCDCAPPTVSLRLLLCLWMWDIFFGGGGERSWVWLLRSGHYSAIKVKPFGESVAQGPTRHVKQSTTAHAELSRRPGNALLFFESPATTSNTRRDARLNSGVGNPGSGVPFGVVQYKALRSSSALMSIFH